MKLYSWNRQKTGNFDVTALSKDQLYCSLLEMNYVFLIHVKILARSSKHCMISLTNIPTVTTWNFQQSILIASLPGSNT